MESVFLALRVLLSLAVVLGLLWMVQRRLTRKSRAAGSANLVTVVARQGISQKAAVVVVDALGTRYLLGVTEHAVSVIGSEDMPVAVPAAEAFATSLSDARMGKADLALITSTTAHRLPAPAGKLRGSILSPAIWKQTAMALRQGLSR
jgi:flagellar protein FliO/FliZ